MQIDRYLGENFGSLILIEYAGIRDITSFTQGAAGAISPAGIVFNAGAGWTKIYCSEDTMGHRQQRGNDVNGESWQQDIIGFIPGDQDAIETGLLSLGQNRFIIRITRPDGTIKIVGNLKEPMDFELDSNSQNNIPGAAGTAIGFSGVTRKRALIYI